MYGYVYIRIYVWIYNETNLFERWHQLVALFGTCFGTCEPSTKNGGFIHGPRVWYCFKFDHMEVFKNWGTPKASILKGCSLINHPFWGTSIYLWKPPPTQRYTEIMCNLFPPPYGVKHGSNN